MATKSQANSTTITRVYEDFQPSSNMVREEGVDTLVIHLSGFKKEQLRVQIDSHGNLKITGERPVEENRWSRFRKEIRVPKHCNTSEISAKFVGGLLYVKLPKKAGDLAEQDEQPTKPLEATTAQTTVGEKRSEQANNGSSRPGLALRLKEKRLIIGVVVALGVAVALGIYAVFRIRAISAGGDGNN